jgi:hypothetical protein
LYWLHLILVAHEKIYLQVFQLKPPVLSGASSFLLLALVLGPNRFRSKSILLQGEDIFVGASCQSYLFRRVHFPAQGR